MEEKWKSRKLWTAVIAAIFAIVGTALGVEPEQLSKVLYPLIVYILGQAGVDLAHELKH